MNVSVRARTRSRIRRILTDACLWGVGRVGADAEHYRLLASNIPDTLLRHDRKGAVAFVAPMAKPVIADAASQLLGQGLFERIHVADRPAYLLALAAAAEGADPKSVELRLRRTLGGTDQEQFVWVEMRSAPRNVCGAQEDRREVVSVLRDIQERKTHEHVVELARADAERANLAKSRFLATMSHELRTPLNVIIGFSEMLVNETQMMIDAARRQEYAKLINESGHHLLSVVNGILDMSKIEAGEFPITPEPFAPAQVVKHCCELLALKARDAGITIETQISNELADIVVDKRALKQVLLNLLSNAIKFTDRGGKIVVRLAIADAFITLVVEDNGVGINEHDLPRLGEPFFQARASYDRRHDGTGLGLSIVKGLVALHGGAVEIHSRVGEGTRVMVQLPMDCERARTPNDKAQPGYGPRFGSGVDQVQNAVRKSA
jgi:cell cycle sensor histidine kinase DivJ